MEHARNIILFFLHERERYQCHADCTVLPIDRGTIFLNAFDQFKLCDWLVEINSF